MHAHPRRRDGCTICTGTEWNCGASVWNSIMRYASLRRLSEEIENAGRTPQSSRKQVSGQCPVERGPLHEATVQMHCGIKSHCAGIEEVLRSCNGRSTSSKVLSKSHQ